MAGRSVGASSTISSLLTRWLAMRLCASCRSHRKFMSDVSAKLTSEHRRRFNEHINKKTHLIGKCSVCSSRSWSLLDHFVQLPLYHTDGNIYMGGGPAYPNVGLVCTNCGNMQLINAMMSGVLDANPSDKKREPDGG